MEKIFISYRPVKGFRTGSFHISLNYIDSMGHHHVIDAGPEFSQKTARAAAETFREEVLSDTANITDSRFGRLVMNPENSPALIKQKANTYRDKRILVP